MGELRKRGNIWWIRYYRNGRRHEESSGSKKKTVAKNLLALREGDKAKGLPVSAKIGQLRFDEAAAQVVADYEQNRRSTTADVEARIRLHIKPFFGDRRMSSITTADVRAYIAKRLAPVKLEDGGTQPGAAPATVNRELAVLKRAFRLARADRSILYIPEIPMLKEANVRSGYFERADFERVRAALPDYLQGVVTFAYLTGWRVPSEVLPLRWGQIDRTAQIVTIPAGESKNDEPRTLPYAKLPELRETIEAAWRDHRALAAEGTICPFVFHRSGVEIKGFRKAWATATKKAGVPSKIPHDFRRTAVRNLVRAGVPDTIAMQITGHRTRSVFDRYNITNEADKLEALGRLSEAMGTEKGQSDRVEVIEAS